MYLELEIQSTKRRKDDDDDSGKRQNIRLQDMLINIPVFSADVTFQTGNVLKDDCIKNILCLIFMFGC